MLRLLPFVVLGVLAASTLQAQSRLVHAIDEADLRRVAQNPRPLPLDDLLLWRIATGAFIDDSGVSETGAAAVERYLASPFSITVSTPYRRALIASDRRNVFIHDVDDMSSEQVKAILDQINQPGVAITVTPGYATMAGSIVAGVFLRVDGRVVRPTAAVIRPLRPVDYAQMRQRDAVADEVFIKAQMADARSGRSDAVAELDDVLRQLRRQPTHVALNKGVFSFPIAAFDGEAVELVCVAADGREIPFLLRAEDFIP